MVHHYRRETVCCFLRKKKRYNKIFKDQLSIVSGKTPVSYSMFQKTRPPPSASSQTTGTKTCTPFSPISTPAIDLPSEIQGILKQVAPNQTQMNFMSALVEGGTLYWRIHKPGYDLLVMNTVDLSTPSSNFQKNNFIKLQRIVDDEGGGENFQLRMCHG